MKNYQIEFILKIKEGNSYNLIQQFISVEANTKKEALNIGKNKLYIPRNFVSINYYEFL